MKDLQNSVNELSIRRSSSQKLREVNDHVKLNFFKEMDNRSISNITRIDNTSQFGPLFEEGTTFE